MEGAAPTRRVFTPTPKGTTAQISKARKVSTEHANTRTMGLLTAPTYAIARVPIAGATSSIPADKLEIASSCCCHARYAAISRCKYHKYATNVDLAIGGVRHLHTSFFY